MPKFYSPMGNPEMWAVQPVDYLTEAEWLALNPPIIADENAYRIIEIKKELIKLDMLSIRPMRDQANEDQEILDDIIKQAQILRDELAGLE